MQNSIESSVLRRKLTIPVTVGLPAIQQIGSIIYNQLEMRLYYSNGREWKPVEEVNPTKPVTSVIKSSIENEYTAGDIISKPALPTFDVLVSNTTSTLDAALNDVTGEIAYVGQASGLLGGGQIIDLNGTVIDTPVGAGGAGILALQYADKQQRLFKFTYSNSAAQTDQVRWGSDNSLYVWGQWRTNAPPTDFNGNPVILPAPVAPNTTFNAHFIAKFDKFNYDQEWIRFIGPFIFGGSSLLVREESGDDYIYIMSQVGDPFNAYTNYTDFDGSSVPITGALIIHKLDSNGNIVWKSTADSDSISNLLFDDTTNSLVTFGSFSQDFLGNPLPPSSYPIFVFDPETGVQTNMYTLSVFLRAVKIQNGFAYVSIAYVAGAGILNYDGSILPDGNSNPGERRTAVIKLNLANGAVAWTASAGSQTSANISSILINNDNLYVLGWLSSIRAFDFSGQPITGAGDEDAEAIVAKLNIDTGVQEWARIAASEGFDIAEELDSLILSTACDDGVIVRVGHFGDDSIILNDFNGDPIFSIPLFGTRYPVYKLNSKGEQVWGFTIITNDIDSNNRLDGIEITENRNLLIMQGINGSFNIYDLKGNVMFQSGSTRSGIVIELLDRHKAIGIASSDSVECNTLFITGGKVPTDVLPGLEPNSVYYFDGLTCSLTRIKRDPADVEFGVTDSEGALYIK